MTASRVRVDRSVFRVLARDVDRAVTTGARPVVARLASALAARSGPAAYRRVYAKLATGIEVRPVPGQPPSITIGGDGGFSGGGTISSLVFPYEYGHAAGDMTRAGPNRSRGRRRRGSQFPPRRASGHWVGPTLEAESRRLETGFGELIDSAVAGVARTRGVR